MNAYQQEQRETLAVVRQHLASLTVSAKAALADSLKDYLAFRREVDTFLGVYFGQTCSHNCYRSRLSACCSRDGIITFFADVVVNTLLSTSDEIGVLLAGLNRSHDGNKCVYLGETGCQWRVKPIICAMFLCDLAQRRVFGQNPRALQVWKALQQRRKVFTWPDQPVLFDALETLFLEAGYTSPVMYLHNSPGLLRVKRKAGLLKRG